MERRLQSFDNRGGANDENRYKWTFKEKRSAQEEYWKMAEIRPTAKKRLIFPPITYDFFFFNDLNMVDLSAFFFIKKNKIKFGIFFFEKKISRSSGEVIKRNFINGKYYNSIGFRIIFNWEPPSPFFFKRVNRLFQPLWKNLKFYNFF